MDGWMDERIDGWTTLASCCCSFAKSCPTLCNPMDMAGGASVHHYLPEFAQIPVHWVGPSNHLTLCCPLLLLPSVFPSTRERFPGQYESTITFLSLHIYNIRERENAFIYYKNISTKFSIGFTIRKWECKWELLSRVQLFAHPWTIEPMEFSRPEYWSG